jgi:hypothetical protein
LFNDDSSDEEGCIKPIPRKEKETEPDLDDIEKMILELQRKKAALL